MSAPGWQTEELQDEWVDLEPEDDRDGEDNLSFGTHSLSLTAPLSTHIHTNNKPETHIASTNTSNQAAGTFLIRDDVPNAPFLPKTPGRKKNLMKDIFTPLQLERMFEPPSPPDAETPPKNHADEPPADRFPLPSYAPNNDELINTSIPQVTSLDRRKPNIACKFTFTVPKELTVATRPAFPQAQSTPNPPVVFQPKPPPTDPRLRLFQFQYDTYTREHLSAMVDSIAINTPSITGTTPSPTTFTHHLSRVSELTGSASLANLSHLRSAKRVKLSPLSDYYGEGAGSQAMISRPKLTGKDYVGESKQLMQQIKSARDFSTISTTVSTHQGSSPASRANAPEIANPLVSSTPPPESLQPSVHLKVAKDEATGSSTSSSTVGSGRSQYSSSSYRKQAEALMAQIKQDMKGQKRIFSGETDVSQTNVVRDDKRNMSPSVQPSPDNTIQSISSASLDREIQRLSVPGVRKLSSSLRSSHRRTSSQTSTGGRNISRISRQDLTDELSRVSLSERRNPSANVNEEVPPPLSTLVPPSYPSASIRAGANEELNRFVSSSTAGGTTVTSGSAPSFVKHAGPAHIRTIAPQDVPSLPDRFGDMVFDKVNSRWVKNTLGAVASVPDEPSEDPFVDIESLRDDSRGGRDGEDSDGSQEDGTARQDLYAASEMSRIEERSELDDEEVDLMSFSTDASSHVVSVMTGVDPNAIEDDAQTTDSEDNVELVGPEIRPLEFDSEEEDFHSVDVPKVVIAQEPNLSSPHLAPPLAPPALTTPYRSSSVTQTTPVVRSVLKSHSATPTSVLKDPNRFKYQTPLQQRSHRRSVSFSDGKLDGPIQGLFDSSNSTTTPFSLEGSDVGVNVASEMVPSARSKRIEEMMNMLEDSDCSEGGSSPSRGSSIRGEELQPLSARQPSKSKSKDESPRRVFSRSQTHRPGASKQDLSRANGTFLTECSFGVAYDRLVAVITDVQPFEPYWEELPSIDLSRKNLESVARLKEFLPRLDALSLNSNQLAWLSGVPGSVRTLSVASNSLTALTSFSHLLNLENLDISRNDVDSLRQLECLRHLRELKADHNKITSLDGLQNMDGLVKISLQDNLMQSVEIGGFKWKRLEMLNVSYNRLEHLTGVESLQSLVALNLGESDCNR
ncbi:hypothetical protein P691DRAFT_201922 [Macrolepiota fuliginosa MF-IS2]|uniref:Septation initiation network scaffold protein cdc11 n=1 Tax=Macrolepiota fuliginosa MF-IS2 TaxID=1400762 RepID=A0A9P5XSX6_9AGAR|nr:hypothetical protein P691DRAFT_201922 [Macrolepiota fuliginosa MF-IS2]